MHNSKNYSNLCIIQEIFKLPQICDCDCWIKLTMSQTTKKSTENAIVRDLHSLQLIERANVHTRNANWELFRGELKLGEKSSFYPHQWIGMDPEKVQKESVRRFGARKIRSDSQKWGKLTSEEFAEYEKVIQDITTAEDLLQSWKKNNGMATNDSMNNSVIIDIDDTQQPGKKCIFSANIITNKYQQHKTINFVCFFVRCKHG